MTNILTSVASTVVKAATTITSVASAIASSIETLSNSTAIQAGWDLLKGLYNSTASVMEKVEAAYEGGANKKAKVFAVLKVLVAAYGLDWSTYESLFSTWIDTIKSAYNAIVTAVDNVVQAAKAPAAAS